MNKKKIFNDPVYGFISIPHGIIFDLIEHPYYQRLRRISQLGLSHYVYPGALHTRFHHALGAMHLMTRAIETLRSKDVTITRKEARGVLIAILLHDVGHAPFSHALEHTLVNVHHEELSELFMQKLNKEFRGKLDVAIQIFKNEYPKKFLHQLVSSQLDMDRMDYLNRDSFFTGVSEGVIGYDRIIKMLTVKNNELVVEEKGIYSIEKFLIARRLMYWQVYLHKTVLAAEQMLIRTLRRAKALAQQGIQLEASAGLKFFLYKNFSSKDFRKKKGTQLLDQYATLDDIDILAALKSWSHHEDFVLAYLSKSIINRRLFKIKMQNEPIGSDFVEELRQKLAKDLPKNRSNLLKYLIFTGEESNSAYTIKKDEIKILYKNGTVLPMSDASDHGVQPKIITKYYVCYPNGIL
ncbi:MAG: HD domain-containing protein [Bacteroidota bacterium]